MSPRHRLMEDTKASFPRPGGDAGVGCFAFLLFLSCGLCLLQSDSL